MGDKQKEIGKARCPGNKLHATVSNPIPGPNSGQGNPDEQSRSVWPCGSDKTINLADNLQDLGLESIDALEMVFDLEEKFGIQIPYNANSAATDFATVGDVVKAIQGLVEQKQT